MLTSAQDGVSTSVYLVQARYKEIPLLLHQASVHLRHEIGMNDNGGLNRDDERPGKVGHGTS